MTVADPITNTLWRVSGPTNTQFALGVHVLTLLAALPERSRTSEALAGSAGASPVHVRRVLGRLREAGLVASRPGVRGGWQLRRPPAEVSLADVWRVMRGDGAVLALHEASPACTVGQRIHSSLADIDRRAAAAVEAELAGTTLADLATGTRADEFTLG
jgi:Rrf2 family protein